MSERIEVTVNTFHGERVLPIEGEWSAWNETTLAVKMTPAAEREMVKAATIHSKGSSCTCGGMRLPEPADEPGLHLVPLGWATSQRDLPPGVAAAVATCERWLNESNRSAAAALLGAKGGAAGRGAAKRRDVDYAALGKLGGRPGPSLAAQATVVWTELTTETPSRMTLGPRLTAYMLEQVRESRIGLTPDSAARLVRERAGSRTSAWITRDARILGEP